MPRKKPPTKRREPRRQITKKAAAQRKSKRQPGDVRRPTLQATLPPDGVPSGLLPLTLQDGTSLGFLLMNVPAIQVALVSRLKTAGFPKALVPAFASGALGVMLPGLAHQVERLLRFEVDAAPFELAGFRFAAHPKQRAEHFERCLSFLDAVAKVTGGGW